VLAAGGDVRWSCDPQPPSPQTGAEAPGDSEQRVACGDASTLLRVSRQPNGRGVELTCFSRRFVDGPDERLGERSRLTGTPPAAGARADAAPAAR
jgi:hypothetical protein